ncbi:MAG: hypothetical protein V1702_05250 [Candidatus Woesearchaeota archaeon]
MLYAASDSRNVDFYKLAQIPPAFSGVLVDWSIGAREVTATLLDLIVRGHLDVSGKTVVKTRKLSKKNFENRFIDAIFVKSSLTFDEVSDIAYKRSYNQLLKIISDGMVEENLVDKDFQAKLTANIKVAVNELVSKYAGPNAKIPEFPITVSGPSAPTKAIVLPRIPKKVVVPIVIFIIVISLFIPFLSIITIPVLFIMLFFTNMTNFTQRSFAPIVGKVEKKLGKTMDWMLTEKGRSIKQQSLELKAYMEKYPLAEDRLANELVGHAVAFGFGKQWMKKLGKKRAGLLLLIEHLNSQGQTMMNFMDMGSFVAEFVKPPSKAQ